MSCDEKAKSMPHFTLLACRKLALLCVEKWIQWARATKIPEDKLKKAEDVKLAMLQWQSANPEQCKMPD